MPALKAASASAPAGSVKRKNGSDARLAIREMKRPDGDIKFIIHVAAVSWAATAVPETKLANQILRKTRFRQALGVAFIFIMGEGGVQPLVRRSKYSRQLTHSGAEASVSAPVVLFFRFISHSHAPTKERRL
jgi:hypothetical protein